MRKQDAIQWTFLLSVLAASGCVAGPDEAAGARAESLVLQHQVWTSHACRVVTEDAPGQRGRVRVEIPYGDGTHQWDILDGCSGNPQFRDRLFDYGCTESGFLERRVVHCPSACEAGVCRNYAHVEDFGAMCDGTTDDGPAIQAAFDHIDSLGGGDVELPAGTCFVDRTLSIGDRTTVFGQGESTIVMRGPTKSYGPLWSGPTNCETRQAIHSTILFMNKGYNCGNEGIELRDFTIDGSQALSASQGSPGLTIAFSAIRDTHVHDITIIDAPQDAIFFRNGGINTSVRNVTIDGFNMKWGNGGGITIEMHPDANHPTPVDSPVVFDGNTIIMRGPMFCTNHYSLQCSTDSDCGSGGICGSGVTALNARLTRLTNRPTPEPHVQISNNHVVFMRRGQGIACVGCSHSVIEENYLEAATSVAPMNARYDGILVMGGRDNVTVRQNTILASGAPGDGHGILADSGGYASITIDGNRIANRHTHPWKNQISVRGYTDLVLRNNEITNGAGGHGVSVGLCSSPTTGPGVIENNIIHVPGVSGPYRPLVFRKTAGISLSGNTVTPAVPPATYPCAGP